ncbi:hypothetical protein IWW37_004887 [Coemansia sp. RSA 2050]|nr:hypothetical protein IWW37_004887 [Coemansia sp. RSA 2050]KAJ2730818.1 hypothetical protein IW152_004986 [Coemansia sp. BCRC 34962]
MSGDSSIPLRELSPQQHSSSSSSSSSGGEEGDSHSSSLSANLATRSPWLNSGLNANGVLSPRQVRNQTNLTLSPAESRSTRPKRKQRLGESESESDREDDGESTRASATSFDDILGDNDNDNIIASERRTQTAASSGRRNLLSRLLNPGGGYSPVDVENGRNRNRRLRGRKYIEPIWSRRMLLLPGILLLSMAALAGIVAAVAWLRELWEHPPAAINTALFPSGIDKARLTAGQYAMRLIHTNDVHARFHPHDPAGDTCDPSTFLPTANRSRCLGGSAYIKSVVDHLRGGDGVLNSLLVDAGDEFQGSIFHTLFAGNVSARLLNAFAYDAVTLGNHEFDHGPELLAQYLRKVHAPALCANLHFLTADIPELQSAIQPFAVIDRHKVGIIGVLTPDTLASSRVGPSINITDPIEAINRVRAELNQRGIHRIIVLSHMGYGFDKQMAEQLDSGISLIVGGHTHSYLGEEDKAETSRKPLGPYPTWIANGVDREWQTAIIQAKSYGDYVGYLDLVFNDDGSLDSQLTQGHLVLVDVVSEDSKTRGLLPSTQITELLRPFEAIAAEFTEAVIGSATAKFAKPEGRQDPHEIAIGNLITDALSWGADKENRSNPITIIGTGSLHRGLPQGEVTRGDLMRTMPFDDVLGRVRLRGDVIRSILRNGNGTAFSTLQMSGLRQTSAADIEVRVGVSKGDARPVIGNWEKLRNDGEYEVLAPMFVLNGGDQLIPHSVADKLTPAIATDSCRDIVEAYFKRFSPLQPILDHRK